MLDLLPLIFFQSIHRSCTENWGEKSWKDYAPGEVQPQICVTALQPPEQKAHVDKLVGSNQVCRSALNIKGVWGGSPFLKWTQSLEKQGEYEGEITGMQICPYPPSETIHKNLGRPSWAKVKRRSRLKIV